MSYSDMQYEVCSMQYAVVPYLLGRIPNEDQLVENHNGGLDEVHAPVVLWISPNNEGSQGEIYHAS